MTDLPDKIAGLRADPATSPVVEEIAMPAPLPFVDPGMFTASSTPLWHAAFLRPLDVTPCDDGVNWVVDPPPFSFESAVLGRILTVPVGQPTDFASIPRLLWSLVGAPTGKYSRAAALHDYLYRTRGICSRRDADAVLWEAMTVCQVPAWTKYLIWWGVRLGGASSYQGGM